MCQPTASQLSIPTTLISKVEQGRQEIPVPAYLCQTGSSRASWFGSGVPGWECKAAKEGEWSIGDLKERRAVLKTLWQARNRIPQPPTSHSQLTLADSACLLLFERIQVKDALGGGGLHPHPPHAAGEEVLVNTGTDKTHSLRATQRNPEKPCLA